MRKNRNVSEQSIIDYVAERAASHKKLGAGNIYLSKVLLIMWQKELHLIRSWEQVISIYLSIHQYIYLSKVLFIMW